MDNSDPFELVGFH